MRYSNTVLGLAIVVLMIFTVIMEIYSYNFLLKQRSREFGLYNILGIICSASTFCCAHSTLSPIWQR